MIHLNTPDMVKETLHQPMMFQFQTFLTLHSLLQIQRMNTTSKFHIKLFQELMLRNKSLQKRMLRSQLQKLLHQPKS